MEKRCPGTDACFRDGLIPEERNGYHDPLVFTKWHVGMGLEYKFNDFV